MKKGIYKAGIELEKDLAMCAVFDECDRNDDAIIIAHGRKENIIECEYKNNYSCETVATGKTHVGFAFHYVTVYYRGYIWNIEPSTYYPFTDENHPGQINATPYLLYDGLYKMQCGYAQPFDGLESLRIPTTESPLKGVYKNPLFWNISEFLRVYNEKAGAREKSIYNAPHVCYAIVDNNDHKIIRCAALERDPDGVRRYFDTDVKTWRIVG